MDPGHRALRGLLRVVGPLLVIVGAGFLIVGIGSFFSSFNSRGGTPDKFWCAFVGMPILAIGFGICRYAYMGAVARYAANEVAPVAKDAINYLAEGTAPGVKKLAEAVGRQDRVVVRCHKCNRDNDRDARFCGGCGASLAKSAPCPKCQELNDPDARFCDRCGVPLASAK
jgi:hypothetical protein